MSGHPHPMGVRRERHADGDSRAILASGWRSPRNRRNPGNASRHKRHWNLPIQAKAIRECQNAPRVAWDRHLAHAVAATVACCVFLPIRMKM